ncbi:MAG: hypothetical protein ACM3YO_09055, partial [Bacteroidota bacterium]
MANPIFPTFPLRSLPMATASPLEAEVRDGVLILRGTLKEKGVRQLKAELGAIPTRIDLSALEEVDGAGFAFLAALGKNGATLVSP